MFLFALDSISPSLTSLQFELKPGQEKLRLNEGITTSPADGIYVRVRART
jgi:hypothetical protein